MFNLLRDKILGGYFVVVGTKIKTMIHKSTNSLLFKQKMVDLSFEQIYYNIINTKHLLENWDEITREWLKKMNWIWYD